MATIDGWEIYEHPEFKRQRDSLAAKVKALRKSDPSGFVHSGDAKLLAAIVQLTLKEIPADPGAKRFLQGDTLGARRKHWFRAKFGNGRYRLFYQYNSKARVIVYAWVNDADSLRAYGAKTDAYAVFRRMLDNGNPPDTWEALLKAAGGPKKMAAKPTSKGVKRGSAERRP